jgi:hypothetical protein
MDLAQLEADLLRELERKGWIIQPGTSREPLLPPAVSQRYKRLPSDLVAFLEKLDSAVNADETVWFLCREDYRRTGGESFRWNEFEVMSLEYDDDAEWKLQVRSFWDRHFPFMLAVHSDYDYLAVSLDERSFGEIVHGCGDDFLEPSPVAPSFAEFLRLHREAAAGRHDEWPLNCFI